MPICLFAFSASRDCFFISFILDLMDQQAKRNKTQHQHKPNNKKENWIKSRKCWRSWMCPSQQTWCFDSPDSRVRPLTTSLHGPAPMALKAWICSSYSVHSSRSSIVDSLSNRSLITFVKERDGRSTRQNFILYPTDSGLPLYCVSGRGWWTTQRKAQYSYTEHIVQSIYHGRLNSYNTIGRQNRSRVWFYVLFMFHNLCISVLVEILLSFLR